MAFVPAIEADDELIKLEILENDDETIASICIGHDDETDATYGVFVAMPIYLPHLPDGRDIHFSVVESLTEDGQDLEYWHKDGLSTKSVLPPPARAIALTCICNAVQMLAKRLAPSKMIMMTATPGLPEKALAKYEFVCEALREIGYTARRDSPFHGTHIWLMTRDAD